MVHTTKGFIPLPKLLMVVVFCVEMLSQATRRAADLLARGIRAGPGARHGGEEGGQGE